jgi:hypothetical protein
MSNTKRRCPKCGNLQKEHYRYGKTEILPKNGSLRLVWKTLGSIYHCSCTGKVFDVPDHESEDN